MAVRLLGKFDLTNIASTMKQCDSYISISVLEHVEIMHKIYLISDVWWPCCLTYCIMWTSLINLSVNLYCEQDGVCSMMVRFGPTSKTLSRYRPTIVRVLSTICELILFAGETGLGKSTLISSLFLNEDLYKDRKLPAAQGMSDHDDH